MIQKSTLNIILFILLMLGGLLGAISLGHFIYTSFEGSSNTPENRIHKLYEKTATAVNEDKNKDEVKDRSFGRDWARSDYKFQVERGGEVYTITCINGHKWLLSGRTAATQILDGDGKPVRCN